MGQDDLRGLVLRVGRVAVLLEDAFDYDADGGSFWFAIK